MSIEKTSRAGVDKGLAVLKRLPKDTGAAAVRLSQRSMPGR